MMPGLADAIQKKFFAGTNYYATGGKRTNANGKEESIYTPVMEMPSTSVIEKHLMGDLVIGAYTLRQDNTITWMCFDVDSSDLQAAKDLTQKLSMFLKAIPHSVEFSGNKGYHVWVFFKKPVPAENIRALAGEIRESIGGKVSGDPHIEIFPKQDKLTESNPLGNLVKVPLGVHPVTKNKSRFIEPMGKWEDGPQLDPLEEFKKSTTIEDFASCLEGYEDPTDIIVSTMSSYWVEGQRHDLSLFLSGWLATAGWDLEDAMTVIEKLCTENGGDLGNQLQAVEDTYKKHEDGGQILGLQALTDRLPGTVIRRLAEAISKQNITPIMVLLDRIRLGKGVTYLKSRSAANAVLSYLQEKGRIVQDIASEKLYWLDKTSHHLHSMEDTYWDSILYNTFGLNTSESFGATTSKGVFHSAREKAHKIKAYNRSYWNGESLYLNLGTAYNYVITGEERYSDTWGHKHLNGEEDIIFRNRDSSLHIDLDQARERGAKPLSPWTFLVDDLNFGIGSTGVSPTQQKELIKAWFLSTFFPDIMPTRPLLTIIADPGAGKTTAARRFLYILEGPHSNVNGVVADKPDSLRASMGSHKFIVLDNLEKNKSYWLVDLLNRISTGTHIELRKLHTTNEVQRILPDCFVILTATALPFAEESLFTRLLPIELAAIKNPTPEYSMQNKILTNLDGIWMGIMGMLNQTVRELRAVKTAPAPTESRLADFTVFCSRIRGLSDGKGVVNGEQLIKGLEMMTNRQKVLLHESSPMIAVLDIWLREDRAQGERQGRGSNGSEAGQWKTAGELNGIWQPIANKLHNQWIWDNGQSLGKHIQALEPNLIRNYGMQILPATNNSPKKFRFVQMMVEYGDESDRTADLQSGGFDIPLDREED